jgi:Rha family phage regulatory protein
MNKLIVPKRFRDLIFIHGDSAETDSLRVATKFSKRHDNVLKAIEELECSTKFREANFFKTTYVDEQGKVRKSYDIAKDGFYILAMGFTGREAVVWKEEFIEAFNWMTSALRKQYENRMQERILNDAIEADKYARHQYQAGALETKCEALAIADKSANDMIEKATRNHFFEVAKLNMKIDQLTGEVMRVKEVMRMKAEEVSRRARESQQREEISRQRDEISRQKAEIRELKAKVARMQQSGARSRKPK